MADRLFWEQDNVGSIPAPPTKKGNVMKTLEQQIGGDHYKKMKIQPIEYIMGNEMPFAEGSVIKYVSRWRSKGGIADLEKARHFIDMIIEQEKASEREPGLFNNEEAF